MGMEERPETLWKDPATKAEINEIEQRLEVDLPDDYKDFLKLSNGFGNNEDGIFNGIIVEPALYPTSEVQWTTCSDTFSDLLVKSRIAP